MLWLSQERAEGLLIRIWVFPPELAILRTATIPTVLVERGIIVNRDEELLISNAQYQDKVVNALVNGNTYDGEWKDGKTITFEEKKQNTPIGTENKDYAGQTCAEMGQAFFNAESGTEKRQILDYIASKARVSRRKRWGLMHDAIISGDMLLAQTYATVGNAKWAAMDAVKNRDSKVSSQNVPAASAKKSQEDKNYRPTTHTYANGSKYVGEMIDGKRHGHGTMTYPDGDSFTGEFKDDISEEGVFTYSDGRIIDDNA